MEPEEKYISIILQLSLPLTSEENTLIQKKIGFDNTEHTPDTNLKDIHEDVSEKVKDFFAPELLNRLDKILIFDQLTLPALEKIALQNTHTIKTQLSQMGISFFRSVRGIRFLSRNSEAKKLPVLRGRVRVNSILFIT